MLLPLLKVVLHSMLRIGMRKIPRIEHALKVH